MGGQAEGSLFSPMKRNKRETPAVKLFPHFGAGGTLSSSSVHIARSAPHLWPVPRLVDSPLSYTCTRLYYCRQDYKHVFAQVIPKVVICVGGEQRMDGRGIGNGSMALTQLFSWLTLTMTD